MSRKKWRASSASPSTARIFDVEMEKQRARARASWKGADKAQIADVYKELPASEFIGTRESEYDRSHLS